MKVSMPASLPCLPKNITPSPSPSPSPSFHRFSTSVPAFPLLLLFPFLPVPPPPILLGMFQRRSVRYRFIKSSTRPIDESSRRSGRFIWRWHATNSRQNWVAGTAAAEGAAGVTAYAWRQACGEQHERTSSVVGNRAAGRRGRKVW